MPQILPLRDLALATLALFIIGCSDSTPSPQETNPPPPSNSPPLAKIRILSASNGPPPLTVTLDATESSDTEDSGARLVARWDFESDGIWDTPYSVQKTRQHLFTSLGSYQPTVEIKDKGSLTSKATLSSTILVTGLEESETASLVADLDADSNRDGSISDRDDPVEDIWTADAGAVFASNLDDDDRDGVRDSLDSVPNGIEDLADMTPLIIRQIDGLMADHRVVISIEPELARNYMRVFMEDGSGNFPLLLEAETPSAVLPNTILSQRDIQLHLEGIIGRFGSFDGNVQITLSIERDDGPISSDTVALRGAPIIFPHHMQPSTRLFLMRIPEDTTTNDSNLAFFNDVQDNLPQNIELYTVDAPTYEYDRWVQDNMQTGYTQHPGPDGPINTKIHLETERRNSPADQRGLIPFLTDELTGPNLGYVYPQGSRSSLNYGGNLEVSPPHSVNGRNFPFGRLVYGGGSGGLLEGNQYTDRMNDNQLSLLNAQQIQGPALEVSSEWLAVGHIDEIFLFLKNNAEGNSPWVVVLASPSLARQKLQQAYELGYGQTVLFQGRGQYETTVESILSNSYLMGFNELAQTRIDSIRQVLQTNLGLSTDDFIEVPVLYENYDGSGLAVALNPGVQNLVAADSVLFVPDPEGPMIDGEDIWKSATLDALAPLGYEVRFVDVFYSYHVLMGEAHCGTNFEREPSSTPWWEVEE